MCPTCQFRVKLHDPDASSKEKDAYDRSLKEKYSESDDYYFHIKDHENVFVIFANGKQMFTTDIESPVEADGLHYISKADLIENELFIVNTGKTEEKSVLDLNQAMYKVEKGYEYGVWPYTHGCLINMDGTDFGSEFKRMREGLDEDRDGLSDIYEKTGMLGANGKLITSNPDKSDSDGDSLTDGWEMGKEYTIVLKSVYNKETGKYTSKMEVNGVPVEYGFNGKRYDRFFKYGEGVWTLYSYKSNPKLEDTDGDYYFDQYDSKPLKNCIETYDLGGGGFNPMITNDLGLLSPYKDEGYIHVENVPGYSKTSFYGGDQSWFGTNKESIEFGGKNIEYTTYRFKDKKYYIIEEGGCGLIALNDVLLYLKNGERKYDFSLEYEDAFFSAADECYNYLGLFGDSQIAVAPVLISNVSEVLEDEGYKNQIIKTGVNEDRMFKKIANSLCNGNPVILNQFDTKDFLDYLSDDKQDSGYYLYQVLTTGANGLKPSNSSERMFAHYVTITGIIKDNEVGNIWVRVQSWGDQYYFLYSDFVKYNSWTNVDSVGSAIIIN